MKLVAIWVENYMRIKNQFFNFGSEWFYNFEFKETDRQLHISREKTENYINFFENTEIVNITGIIGRNGSGKTSLLKLLNVIYNKSPLFDNVVLLFEKEKEISIKLYSQKIPKPNSLKTTDIKTIITNINNISSSSDPLNGIDLIFYSKLVSVQNDKYIPNILNRSTDYQIRKSFHPDRIKAYLEDYEESKDNQILAEESFDILKLFEKDKLKRHINFIADVKSNYKGLERVLDEINLPKYIDVWFNNEHFIKQTNSLIEKSGYNFKRLQDVYTYCFQRIKLIKNIKLRFKNHLIYSLFLFSFYNDSFKFSKNNTLTDLTGFVNSIKLDETVFEQLKGYLLKQQPYKKTLIEKIIKLLKYYEENYKYFEISIYYGVFGLQSYRIEINNKSWTFLDIIFSITDFTVKDIIEYSINPMSAGEDAIINQFAEFYKAISQSKNEFVYVTIDEGELFLHPEWQRKYINNLFLFFDFFGRIKGHKFQLIVTSHSPFIVSDIPKFNLIFLDRSEDGNCKAVTSTTRKNTFGGNVFELFSDGFFVNEFISDYAYKKLNEILKELNNTESKLKKEDIERIETVINLVGEPIIKEELKKLLNRKRNSFFKDNYELIKNNNFNI